MRRMFRQRPSPGFVVAMIALFLGASGTTLAARSGPDAGSSSVGENSVGSSELKDRSVRNRDLGTNSVHGRVIPDDSIGGDEVNEKTLGQVPQASGAEYAERADVANFATTAGGLSSQITIPRTTVDLTGPVDAGLEREGGNVRNLASIGRLRVDGVCRITERNGIGRGFGSPPAPLVEEGQAEAKIVIWSTDGTLSFQGLNGPRMNVPGGAIAYNNTPSGNPTPSNPQDGEGEHQFIGASNDSGDEERFYLSRYPAFHAGGGYAAVDLGDEITLNVYAGVNVLGAIDRCVFGGTVSRIR